MITHFTPLILASTSRYRRELLERLRVPFECVAPDVDETPRSGETPQALALRLAQAKAGVVSRQYPGRLVIGSDQVATVDGQPMGKPGDLERARLQLRRLSGKAVEFHTAVAVTDSHRVMVDDVVTTCHFRPLSDAEIDAYLHIEAPFDTAGSAKIEQLGIALLSGIEGNDPTAIIGLPMIRVCEMLRSFGLEPLMAATAGPST